jgi:hypothetical protein
MRHLFLAGAALGLLALATPASAMPVGKIAAPGIANDDGTVVQVRYRHRYRAYTYRPRARYVYRNYGYDDGYRSYGYYGGGPSYYGGGYGPGYYGGGPSIGFSFGTGRW